MKNNHTFITYEEINIAILNYINNLSYSLADRYSNIYPVMRGGLIPASILSYNTKLQLSYKLTSHSLIVDDICDSGATLSTYTKHNKIVLINLQKSNNIDALLSYKKNNWYVFPWEAQTKTAIKQDKEKYNAKN